VARVIASDYFSGQWHTYPTHIYDCSSSFINTPSTFVEFPLIQRLQQSTTRNYFFTQAILWLSLIQMGWTCQVMRGIPVRRNTAPNGTIPHRTQKILGDVID